jgi:hypothetical protein
MLGNKHFYNRTIRKIVVAFGTIFNDITLVRFNKDGTIPKERFLVPLSYGPKEKYLTRITSDPNLTKSVGVVVPRISFELTCMSYDTSRKKSSLVQNFAQDSDGKLAAQYNPVPYDFSFSLSIYVRNTEDGTQILEQILPFFNPDFTVTVNFIPELKQIYDVPIILNSVNTTTDYEGDMMTTRLIIWDLEFTVKGYVWPPVRKPNGLIGAYSELTGRYGQANTNIYVDTQDRKSQRVFVDYANGVNYFSDTETIRVLNKNINGKVVFFSNNETGILVVNELNQLLTENDILVGDFSNAKYKVLRVDKEPVKTVEIITTAVPPNPDPDDEFGFAETITEFFTGKNE